MQTRSLTLNRYEVMLLSDRIQNAEIGTDDMRVVGYRILLKLGILFLDLVDEGQEVRSGEISVSESEAWLIRDKVKSGDKLAADPLAGAKLLRKVYRLLLDFEADVDSLPSADAEGESMGAWQREALGLWHAKEDTDGLQPA